MALGDNRFSKVVNDFSILLEMHGAFVVVTRTDQSKITDRNIFGEPTSYTPDILNIKVLVIDKSLDESAVISGGKPKEKLKLIVSSNTLIEEDDIKYCNHSYSVKSIEQLQIGGTNNLDICEAVREVEV